MMKQMKTEKRTHWNVSRSINHSECKKRKKKKLLANILVCRSFYSVKLKNKQKTNFVVLFKSSHSLSRFHLCCGRHGLSFFCYGLMFFVFVVCSSGYLLKFFLIKLVTDNDVLCKKKKKNIPLFSITNPNEVIKNENTNQTPAKVFAFLQNL